MTPEPPKREAGSIGRPEPRSFDRILHKVQGMHLVGGSVSAMGAAEVESCVERAAWEFNHACWWSSWPPDRSEGAHLALLAGPRGPGRSPASVRAARGELA